MNCLQLDQLKDAYVAGMLNPNVGLDCALHVADCASCRQRLAEARTRRLHTQGIHALLASPKKSACTAFITHALGQPIRPERATGGPPDWGCWGGGGGSC